MMGGGGNSFDAKVKPGDAVKFIDDITIFWNDPRYITIGGHPVLTVYRIADDPNIASFIGQIKEICITRNIPTPYVMIINAGNPANSINPADYNADALTEFAMHIPNSVIPAKNIIKINHAARFGVADMDKFFAGEQYLYDSNYPLFKGCMTSYDNCSRHLYSEIGAGVLHITPKQYEKYLSDIIKWTYKYSMAYNPDKLIFIAAWNEWAECMCLEPDRHYGYSYLDATKRVLQKLQK